MRITLIVLMFMSCISSSMACWMATPAETRIERSDIIVIGEIIRKESTVVSEGYKRVVDNSGIIKIDEIFFNQTDMEINVNDEIPLHLPQSVRLGKGTKDDSYRVVTKSTSLFYYIGDTGIWILSYRNDKFYTSHPKNFQPLSEKENILELINSIKEDVGNTKETKK